MKKIPCIIMTLVLCIGLAMPVLAAAPTTTPTAPNIESASSWARDDISLAVYMGLVPQALQSNYTAPATRAEFAALAVALYERINSTITGRVNFADTADMNVEKMAYLGVVQGVGNNMFAPHRPITREAAAVFLSRLINALDHLLLPQAPTFADNYAISGWAVEGVGQVQASNIMGGVGNNRFAPQSPYTREQSIITMLRIYDAITNYMHHTTNGTAPGTTSFTIPNRVLTQAELNTWKSEYHTQGGIHAFELEVLELVNAERAYHGLQPLNSSPTLMMASRFKAQSMHDIGYFAHTSPVYGHFANISRQLFGYPEVAMGENLASGQRTPQAVVNAWMNSEGHRANILNPIYTEMGVGFLNFYWVQKFGNANTANVPAPTGL